MQQRRLRLGDILDDYCPRERRITNHAVVAMIEDDVKQTRCTTCDAEHEYKQGRLPALRRKKDSVAKAYNEVLTAVTTDAAMQAAQATARQAGAAAPESEASAAPAELPFEPLAAQSETGPHEPSETEAPEPTTEEVDAAEAAGRVHRRLIRATLPRSENQPVQRPVPEFTMRQPQGRTGKFRSARGPAGRSASGRPGGHAGGHANGNSRGGFGRTNARTDFHRPPRGGQPARRDKKHSK